MSSTRAWRLVDFNPRRHARGAEAARVYIYEDGEMVDWLWMSARDARLNIRDHGDHPELRRVIEAYKTPAVEIRDGKVVERE